MKKALLVVLIAALSMSMLAVIAGCGTNQNKQDAQTYMKAGDDYMATAKVSSDYLQEKQASFTSVVMSGDLSAFTGAAGDALKKDLEDNFAKIDQNLKLANDEYNKIIALDDVQDYKDYAAKMMEAIAVDQQTVLASEKLLSDLGALIAQKAAGQPVDILTAMMNNPEIQQLTDLQEKSDSLKKEAEQIKLDKKL
jgi:hypothetical protein